jgi:hypothetical protein
VAQYSIVLAVALFEVAVVFAAIQRTWTIVKAKMPMSILERRMDWDDNKCQFPLVLEAELDLALVSLDTEREVAEDCMALVQPQKAMVVPQSVEDRHLN